uniref:Putative alpha toxin Tx120 n=1 Tax=Buthus israelis TaxID=2899555 RepID=B8XGY3_BUTIS|nr:putative alpha toxin Tx120 [Buthus occitanus israelis]
MNYLIIISLALLLMTGAVSGARDGYLVDDKNCAVTCALNKFCNTECIKNGAESGYCQWLGKYGNACWCIKLPNKVPIKVPGTCKGR